MNALTATKSGTTEHAPAGFEEKLIWLTKFGKPNMFKMDKGWNAGIDMHVASTGSTFKVDSNYNHDTPSEAVDVLIERMLAALAMLVRP